MALITWLRFVASMLLFVVLLAGARMPPGSVEVTRLILFLAIAEGARVLLLVCEYVLRFGKR